MISKLTSETAQAIMSDLADRRGMQGDLEFGDDWEEAREAVASPVQSAVDTSASNVVDAVEAMLEGEANLLRCREGWARSFAARLRNGEWKGVR